RKGWWAIGGFVSTALSLFITLHNKRWKVREGAEIRDENPLFDLAMEVAVAAMVQDQLNWMTNRSSSLRILAHYLSFSPQLMLSFWPFFLSCACSMGTEPSLRIRWLSRMAIYIILLLWIESVGVIQMVYDIKEC